MKKIKNRLNLFRTSSINSNKDWHIQRVWNRGYLSRRDEWVTELMEILPNYFVEIFQTPTSYLPPVAFYYLAFLLRYWIIHLTFVSGVSWGETGHLVGCQIISQDVRRSSPNLLAGHVARCQRVIPLMSAGYTTDGSGEYHWCQWVIPLMSAGHSTELMSAGNTADVSGSYHWCEQVIPLNGCQ